MKEFVNGLSETERKTLKGIVGEQLRLAEGKYSDSITLYVGKGTIQTLVSNDFPRYKIEDVLKLLNVSPDKVYGSKGLDTYVPLEWIFSQKALERPLRVNSNVRYAILKYYVECIERQLL